MTWKIWRWQWWRPPPDDESSKHEQNGGTVDPADIEAALRRAHDDGETADHLTERAHDLERRARTQKVDNHFGHDLYKVMRTRRNQE